MIIPELVTSLQKNTQLRKSEVWCTRSSVFRLVITVLPTWGEKLAVHTISQLQGIGIADIRSPITTPVNINHHLLSPGVLAADVERGAAVTVTGTGQRLNTPRRL